MTHGNAAQNYQQETARGASAIGGVVALYDTILRDFRRASAAAAAGNIEARVFELNHALTIIGELNGVLDYQRGGEAAKRFHNFYEVTRGLILDANLRATPESLEHLIALYSPVRHAWHKIDSLIPSGQPRDAQSIGSRPAETADSAEDSAKWNA